MKTIVAIIMVIMLLFSIGCGDKRDTKSIHEKVETASPEPGNIYTAFVTIQPFASLAESIAGGLAEVKTLLPPGSEPHTYEPTPGDLRTLAGSALLFKVGMGLDEWAARIAMSAEDGPRIISLSLGVPTLPAAPERIRARLREQGEMPAHGNPHIWLDPFVVSRLIVPTMVGGFSVADPENTDYYRANGERLSARIEAVANEIGEAISPLRGRPVILYHSAFLYFCRQYGIPVMDVIEPFPGQEPTARNLAKIIDDAVIKKPFAILYEPQFSRKSSEIIAEGAGIPIITVDPLGTPEIGYIELIKRNARAIIDAAK